MKKIINLITRLKIHILVIFALGLIIDIFFNPKISDSIVILLIIFWLISLKNFKIKAKTTFFLAAGAFFVAFLSQFFNQEAEVITEKGASWFFIFLTIGLVQKLTEKNEKKV